MGIAPDKEFYQMMDRLAGEIAFTDSRIRLCQAKGQLNERRYHEEVWEELVLKHMEFEDILYDYRRSLTTTPVDGN